MSYIEFHLAFTRCSLDIRVIAVSKNSFLKSRCTNQLLVCTVAYQKNAEFVEFFFFFFLNNFT